MTTQEARDYFKAKGLTYDILTDYALDLLATYIQVEILAERKTDPDCILVRINPPKTSRKREWFEITVNGTYFNKREGVTFNRDGFIGFCGWASTKNARIFIDGFVKWCDEMAKAEATP